MNIELQKFDEGCMEHRKGSFSKVSDEPKQSIYLISNKCSSLSILKLMIVDQLSMKLQEGLLRASQIIEEPYR
jgi:hypothetical protein